MFPRRHIRSYAIKRKAPYSDHVEIYILSIYGETDNDVNTMVGNAHISITRDAAAKILRDNRRAGLEVTRNPLVHSPFCPCNWKGN